MNKLMWRNGCILHPADMWKYKTARRIPELLVTKRSEDVVIKVTEKSGFILFSETTQNTVAALKSKDKQPLIFYKQRYVLPEYIEDIDALEFLKKKAIFIFSDKTSQKMYFKTEL